MGDIALTRDTAADSIAIVRLLRTNQPDMAMFLLSSYRDDPDAMQALVGSMAAFANALLSLVGNPAGVLQAAAAAVVGFDPGEAEA